MCTLVSTMNAFAADRGAGDPVSDLLCAPANGASNRSAASNRAAAILMASGVGEVRQTRTELLNGEGYRVTSVDNGEAALQLLQEARFDLVVASVVMPRLDGLELLWAMSAGKAPPPVIIVAAGHG
jgi:PleD family two-component response regulator